MGNARTFRTVLSFVILAIIQAFNVDTDFPIIFQREQNTYFGFSVALHRNSIGPLVLVSAPRANSSYFGREAKEPGALFGCQISFPIANQNCREVDLNKPSSVFTGSRALLQEGRIDNMWLGISLDSQQALEEDNIVVCGHLWKNQNYDANGVCYVINSDLDPNSVKKLLPFIDPTKRIRSPPGVPYFAYGQVGCSATFSENGDYLLLGAPGFFNWTGTVLKYEKKQNGGAFNFDPTTVVPQDPTRLHLPYSSYIGYATSSGRFFASESIFLAAGAPRDGDGRGQVYLVEVSNERNKEFIVHDKKRGTQFGEYFGASVLGINLNGDDFTDLLVGAPFSSLELGADEGKVYVYISDGFKLEHFAELVGEKRNSRFGTSIGNLGDINQDGFNDVAIGAPYEDGSGAIYIYHGARAGLNTNYAQKIAASEIHGSLKGFGISISRGLDIDSNYYPDVLVGSYASSNAVLFRTHPVIEMNATIHSTPEQINTNLTLCSFGGENLPCIKVTSCFRYSGKHAQQSLEFSTELLIDWDRLNSTGNPRGFSSFQGQRTSRIQRRITSRADEDTCFDVEVLVRKNTKDFITPMLFVLKLELAQDGVRFFCKSCPVIDPRSSTQFNKSIPFLIGCGTDSNCSSDLVIEAEVVNAQRNVPLILGQNKSLTLDITVTNHGESAYVAVLYIRLPDDISIVKKDFCTILNQQEKQLANADLLCFLGNPLEAKRKVVIQIKMDISNLPTSREELNLHVEAKTTSFEVNPTNNQIDISLPLKAMADISIIGTSEEDQIPFIESDAENQTTEVTHTYFIRNKGPSPLQLIDIELRIPTSIDGRNGRIEFLSFTDLKIENDQNMQANCNTTSIELKSVNSKVKKNETGTMEGNDVDDYEESGNASSKTPLHPVIDSVVLSANGNSKRSFRKSKPKPSTTNAKDVILNCETARCVAIDCSAGPFSDIRKFAQFKIKAEIDITALEDALPDPWSKIEFFTYGRISVRERRVEVNTENQDSLKTSVKTVVLYPGILASREVANWIIYVSVGIGILLLLIILIIFIKIGFFKRQEKDKMKELMQQDDPQEMEAHLVSDQRERDEEELEINNFNLNVDDE